ncbi:hypothetical protein [Streptomyces sp. NPDC048106]
MRRLVRCLTINGDGPWSSIARQEAGSTTATLSAERVEQLSAIGLRWS